MPDVVTTQQVASQVGWLPAIMMLVGVLATVGFMGYLWKLAKTLHSMAEKITKIDSSICHKEGDPVVHYSILREIEHELQELRQDSEEHITQAGKHYEDVIRLNSQEAYAHCNIDKCPHLITVIGNIKAVGALFEQFTVKAEESRNSTGASLKDIQNQMQVLAAEVSAQSKQVVQLLGDVLVGRKTK